MMEGIHDGLQDSAASGGLPSLGHVDPSMALQEFESNGQGGLDALLAAMDASDKVRNPACTFTTCLHVRYRCGFERRAGS